MANKLTRIFAVVALLATPLLAAGCHNEIPNETKAVQPADGSKPAGFAGSNPAGGGGAAGAAKSAGAGSAGARQPQ